jgi:hypothetical protein
MKGGGLRCFRWNGPARLDCTLLSWYHLASSTVASPYPQRYLTVVPLIVYQRYYGVVRGRGWCGAGGTGGQRLGIGGNRSGPGGLSQRQETGHNPRAEGRTRQCQGPTSLHRRSWPSIYSTENSEEPDKLMQTCAAQPLVWVRRNHLQWRQIRKDYGVRCPRVSRRGTANGLESGGWIRANASSPGSAAWRLT